MTFRFSDNTLQVIDNFAKINPGMIFNPGKMLQTLEPTKAIFATAKIDDEIPNEFVVHDLSRFLGVLRMHDKETLSLDVVPLKLIVVNSKIKNTNYRMTDKSNVIHPDKAFTMPASDVKFKITADQIEGIIKDTAAMGLPHVVFTGQYVIIKDAKNDSSDEHKIKLTDEEMPDYKAVFKFENFGKLLRGTGYTVEFSKRVAHFQSENGNIDYYIAVENLG